MKKLFLLVAFIGALLVNQTARANQGGFLVGLYNSVSNQLFIVSNTPPVDAKLAKSLNSALASIQKSGGGVDLPSAIKGLGSVVKIVNRTSVSNALSGDVHATLVSCANQYIGSAITFSNQVAGLFPSKGQTAALNAISNLLTTVASINANANITAALKALTGLSKQTATIQKSVTAAQKAPAPAASITAAINITGLPTFNFQSTQATAGNTAGGNFFVNSLQTSGSGAGTTLHSFAFGIYGLVSGQNTVSGSDGEYSRAGLSGSISFAITSSSLHLNWDPTHKFLSGTFSFNLLEEGGTGRTGTVTGNLSLYYP
jgi:hypothetical protein